MPRANITRRQLLQTVGVVGASMTLEAASAVAPEVPSPFRLQWENGTISGLQRAGDAFPTEYIEPGHKLGSVFLRYRRAGEAWNTVQTESLPADARTESRKENGRVRQVVYRVTEGSATDAPVLLTLTVTFAERGDALQWKLAVQNHSDRPLEIGDLALPLPMNTHFQQGKPATASVLKHSFISGEGAFLFWMRSNSVGPYLTMTPLAGTSLEYWDKQERIYRVFLHSTVAGEEAKAKACRWRQPHTSTILAPKGQKNDSRSYGFRFDWCDDYTAVRQRLVDNGLIDVHIVPGMTLPTDLHACFALRTKQKIHAIEAEFPDTTHITFLGKKGNISRYQVAFSRLGENRLTVRFGKEQHLHLEWFCTEPLETLIQKRATFIAHHQHRNTGKWYEGLLAEWNNETQTLLGPDNYDRIKGWRIYEVTCDDPGLSKPAYLAAKNAEYPVPQEVEALDYYIQHFVWGGLQRTTEETYPYGIYGIPDWKTNRDSADTGTKGKLHIWRIYDYPHIILMYFGMYRVAKHHPQIPTALTANEYLRRALETAVALFTIPEAVIKWSAYETGLYNELVIVDLLQELEAVGWTTEAQRLRAHWEKKVRFFLLDNPDLFGSEYPFDSTGFESTHALAKYALDHVGEKDRLPGVDNTVAKHFLETQMAANLFCRGWLEPAYYLLGSDYRATAGDAYTLSYMAQMGGWSVLDYALHFAKDPFPYLRLGYASALSSWALMNTGTPASDYGYWFPGAANDGAAGGGFEPAPNGETWLGQPHHRGSWYYSCEIDLGFCGALRAAATVLADDPIFGRFCFGGDWHASATGVEVIPRDGVRRRFHAVLGADRRLHLETAWDRFAVGVPIVLAEDLSRVAFHLESDNPQAHDVPLHIAGLPTGTYRVQSGAKEVAWIEITQPRTVITVPLETNAMPTPVTIVREPKGGRRP